MISNRRLALTLVAILAPAVASGGCRARAPAEPARLQGVVDLGRNFRGFEVPGRLTQVLVQERDEVPRGRASLDQGVIAAASVDEVEGELARAVAERQANRRRSNLADLAGGVTRCE